MSRILIVEDNETMRTGVALVVERMGHEAVAVASGPEGLARLREGAFDLVITDYRMEGMDGLAVLEAVKRERPETDVVLITAHGTVEIAVEAMKKGAVDFIAKPFPPDELRLRVEKALAFREARQARERLDEENRYLREEIGGRYNFGEMVGRSAQMQEVFARVQKVAASDSSVLIYGESGTGKELVARAIHQQSTRRDGPFVKVNCGALPRELVESELFGHEKGAFTGAVRQKKGKFELAGGGTIFLDEVGDIPLEVQVNLLRVLQEKEFDRVGGEKTLTAEVRVVAATNRPLKEMVAQGTFREDLFYRLEVIPIRLPPLRDRKEDIPLLVEHFLHKKCSEMSRPDKRITPEAMAALTGYGWPGNVRELENVIERTIVLSDGEEIGPGDLPLAAEAEREGVERPALPEGEIPLNRMLDDLERQLIERAMERAGGVKARAAQMLGIKTSALYYKLEKYGLG
ncbi:MAG: Fis family transcriptional regulator [Candidatus Handelsmanbacteria bacterium RIFCSPLOWO2_12_FULL_64_10]|uniref:Fis family transcriptional regulator n=1 Tax=Handelsmanbacteria sp. (strain RIFCSPLOWO2_12_FULL_64_10) TaxID=1817868 RepID=A0A1F6C7F9_HANXR|nr:MAG: Fis family transcriptional regulator [Candidatus Handelsmanbacteria bacterium RIFCSPLOWO2_12_FULL_64_10]